MMQILAISGSLRSGSTNTALLQALKLCAAEFDVVLYQELSQIPPFNPDLEPDWESNLTEGAVPRLRSAIRSADAVVFSTPEYAHGIPGALKNALDWVVGSGEFSGKAVTLLNASHRGEYARASLREIITTMDARFVHQAEVTVDLMGNALTPEQIAAKQDVVTKLHDCVRTLASFARNETLSGV